MATQVRIRRRGRIRALMVATGVAAICLLPASAASADTRAASSTSSSVLVSETRDEALLPVQTDVTAVAIAGLAALGIGSVVVKKAGI